MENMKVKFKKLGPLAVLPKYAKYGDAGMDITATSSLKDPETGLWVFGTDLAVEIPKGYVGLLFPRSSISKTRYILSNSVGVIDSSYRGEIKFKFRVGSSGNMEPYRTGDRIGQLLILPYPSIEPEWSDELSTTERGVGGFGSTGNSNATS